MKETIRFELNSKPQEFELVRERSLLWVLKAELGMTGVKFGCGMGYCGSCTVLLNGKAVRSCMIPANLVNGKKVTTIEGLASNGKLHPVQRAFIEHDAMQCGYCTPGMIMTACSFLNEKPGASRQEMMGAMEANLCRCGAHKRIIAAMESASEEMKGGTK